MMLVRAYQSPLTFWFALSIVLVTLIGWVFPASLIAFRPGAVTVADGAVMLERSFPGDAFDLPRPVMTYRETVRPLTPGHNGGHPCVQTGGPIRYTSPQPVGTWSLDWAAACLDDPAGFHWEAAWRWHVGAIQLGPVRAAVTVLQPQNGATE